DWATYYPAYAVSQEVAKDESGNDGAVTSKAITKPVEIADIGCGFGGLLFALAPRFPDTLLLGMFLFFYMSRFSTFQLFLLRFIFFAPSCPILSYMHQAWKSAPRSPNTYKTRSGPCAPKTQTQLPT